jgi:phosphonate transport system substrate-binding protein
MLIRGICAFCIAAVLAGSTPAIAGDSGTASPPMQFGLTPVFLDNQPKILWAWQDYLEKQLDRKVVFVQRRTYREIIEGLGRGEIDAAWLCGLPYVEQRERLSLVATPSYQGAPLYRSYLIVPDSDTQTRSWKDLSGGVFAFSDPDSNSGYLYPRWAMQRAGINPEFRFRKYFYAHSHRNVIEAVAAGLAHAGAVDGYVWETLNKVQPGVTERTRVVERSETFGFPPIVSRLGLPQSEVDDLQDALLRMAGDPQGQKILQQLNLDGFVRVQPGLYDSIAKMSQSIGKSR